jgi:pyruvate/2-oxoglutarate dehydrogenase complex dihydrolipoamide acyltransferase (E2) component
VNAPENTEAIDATLTCDHRADDGATWAAFPRDLAVGA